VIGMMWYDGWGWGGWFAMAIFMVLFWALVIAGVVVLVRYVTGSRHGQQSGGPPVSSGEPRWGGRPAEELLAERFARGEIDEDEYKRRLTLLREHR
jgi:putative membrane protein